MTVKIFLLLSVCAVVTFAHSFNPLLVECMKDLKMDIDLTEDSDVFEKRFNELSRKNEAHCILACFFRRSDKNANSLYEVLTRSVNGAKPYQPERRMKVLEKLNKCNETDGDDDCKLMTCFDINKPPVLDHFILLP